MSSNIVEIQENEENKEDNQNNNNLMKKESPNINDNENNKILEKEEHINESTSLKEITNNEKDEKNNFYHDKDITEDSVIYFSNKLKLCNKNYKVILYLSIILYIIDLFIFFEGERILYNIFNFFAIFIILISSFHQAFIFRHDFNSISKELYLFTQKIIYINIGIFSAFIINMIYIAIAEIYKILNTKRYYKDESLHNTLMIFYCFINLCIPSIHLYRLISIKKGIKDLSSAKGEIYETAKIEDIEIINSVINEI